MISIGKQYSRYLKKSSASGRYNRHINRAYLNGIITGVELLKAPQYFNIEDIGITSFFGTMTIQNIKLALKDLKDLKPIKQRAIQIKKASTAHKPNLFLQFIKF